MAFAAANDGVQLHFETFGAGEEGWIFLHGWGGAAAFWREFLTDHFDLQNRRAIAISFRGHGDSAATLTGYSFQQFAADIIAVADAAGLKQFSLAGFSLGGKVAAWLAAHHPERLRKLVLISPVAPGLVPFERAAVQQLCDSASDLLVLDGFFRSWFSASVSRAAYDSVLVTMAATPARVLMATAELLAWTSIAAEVGEIRLPALILAGERDPVYSPDYQRKETLPFVPNARFTVVAGGHFVPIEQPAELAREINAL